MRRGSINISIFRNIKNYGLKHTLDAIWGSGIVVIPEKIKLCNVEVQDIIFYYYT
ncbi:hypothetical protein Lac2_24540 [Claveliimonas bilis]|nr:hypothetical protein Lac2_24540 [Claveliimonas bilis]